MSIQNLNSSDFIAGHTQCTVEGTCSRRGRLMARRSQENVARENSRPPAALRHRRRCGTRHISKVGETQAVCSANCPCTQITLSYTHLALEAIEKEHVFAGGQFCHSGASIWHRRGSSASSDGSCSECERRIYMRRPVIHAHKCLTRRNVHAATPRTRAQCTDTRMCSSQCLRRDARVAQAQEPRTLHVVRPPHRRRRTRTQAPSKTG